MAFAERVFLSPHLAPLDEPVYAVWCGVGSGRGGDGPWGNFEWGRRGASPAFREVEDASRDPRQSISSGEGPGGDLHPLGAFGLQYDT